MESKMESVFFAKFDDIVGPKVVCEVARPQSNLSIGQFGDANYEEESLLSANDGAFFDRVKDFIITKKQLCGSLLTVSDDMTGCKVMSYPLYVEDEKVYARNVFFFAFGFIFKEDVQVGAYEAVLRKLSDVMRSVEVESQFLSADDPSGVRDVLKQVVSDLSAFRESIVSVDERNVLALKLKPRLVDPTDVMDHQVPVQTRRMDQFVTKEYDLTIQQVIRYIDGERHVRLIAEESGVAVALVRRCVRQLLYFRCVRLVDIFQYSNSYTCTPRLVELVEDERLQKDCLHFVCAGRGEKPELWRVFGMYAFLHPCLTLRDFCTIQDPGAYNVNLRRLITFGVLHSLIRRVQTFPVLAPSVDKTELKGRDTLAKYRRLVAEKTSASLEHIRDASAENDLSFSNIFGDDVMQGTDQETDQEDESRALDFLVDGQHNLDSVCAELWCSSVDLRKTLSTDEDVVFINTN
ncbi:GATOR complex protein NPRL2 [Hondaea fermentalgiana]|uniref:GATOR complex protein NPRL2 n=1 Tax=Hondaea fermentalgiana TaxID=2315210 RepID=A0A2R5GHQ1_9STRA|nr:GATOR complex protein NPRL2 [Hondaea fermentalgiana]|eukprot:GBG27404.1 GATOR complex protein NPRL2 [Hondaea fermentalgiana]